MTQREYSALLEQAANVVSWENGAELKAKTHEDDIIEMRLDMMRRGLVRSKDLE